MYADHWIGYRLAFESEEEIINSVYPPLLNDRYPPYTKVVDEAERPAYIFMQTRSAAFEAMLAEESVRHYKKSVRHYKKEELFPFVVFYDQKTERTESRGTNDPD